MMIDTEIMSEIVREASANGPEGRCVGAMVLAAQRRLRGSSSGRLTVEEWSDLTSGLDLAQ